MNAKALIVPGILVLLAIITTQAEVRRYENSDHHSIVWVQDDPWRPESFDDGLILPASFVTDGPDVDGRADDPAWSGAHELKIELTHGTVREARLQAVYTEDRIFLMVSWPDPTRSDLHHPWVWDQELERYVEGTQVEDSLLISLESGCEWTPSLLSGYVYDFDGWRWLAARTNPLGQAVDINGHTQDRWIPGMGFVKYESRNKEPFWNLKFIDKSPGILTRKWQELDRAYQLQPTTETIYVSMEPDGYRPPRFVQRSQPPAAGTADRVVEAALGEPGAPTQEGPKPLVPQYLPVPLTGDAGEVQAKGQWRNGRWTVEFSRALETEARTMTDSVLNRLTQFSIHVFDSTERVDQSSESGRLFLQFEPAGGLPRNGR